MGDEPRARRIPLPTVPCRGHAGSRVLGTPWLYLGLGEPQLGGQLGALGQRQVLGLLEALVEGLELQAGVDGAGLAELLPLAVDAQLPVGDGRRLVVLLGEERSRGLHHRGRTIKHPSRPDPEGGCSGSWFFFGCIFGERWDLLLSCCFV